MNQPELAVLVSTYQRPAHLRRVLASIAVQRGVEGALEVVVTDDGSCDETQEIVREFAGSVRFPVQLTSHHHAGFQLARCRNEGVAASSAPYLLFLDGDCLIPPDHLRVHLDRRRAGFALAAYCINLAEEATARLSVADVQAGRFRDLPPWHKWLELRYRHLRAQMYALIRDRKRPKLPGGNIGIARADYERVNGYDENFRGWGCEDDDLRLRLRAAGIRIASISSATNTFHMWHPKSPSAPQQWRDGQNVNYLRRPVRLTRCLAGLTKRSLADLQVRLVGRARARELAEAWLPRWCCESAARREIGCEAEIEFAFAGVEGEFSPGCACRVLIVPPGQEATARLAREATVIFADSDFRGLRKKTHRLSEIDQAFAEELGFREPARPVLSRVLQFA
jgi:GT2 family glycosyltransferase